ncbi:Non-canonical non-ribosomal peptide synthetase FUB8 [Colletotrichum trifolii]|uniref:Non-canonical non-ribosomal peptide synthetase FUB8 n=1 Tax=Colletotrichum trifolii TaxID=5466 RepID=A0A4R8R0R6_COLTR|nr:Non-canonical non-ribosomal peptide synthetase FUB8 [Colletotrichum trifolii]
MSTTAVQTATEASPQMAYENRTLPAIIDDRAANEPMRESCSIPRTSNPRDGWRPVTYKEFANAIDYMTHFILRNCGSPGKDSFPTIAYIGPNDIRYCIMMIAAIKAGYKSLFVSPRNPLEAQLNLFNLSDCHIVIRPPSHAGVVDAWVQHRQMETLDIEDLDALLSKPDVPVIPYTKTAGEAEWDPFLVLHTSGSTGLPKPIVTKHGSVALLDSLRRVPEWNGTRTVNQVMEDMCRKSYNPIPLFHAGGVYGFVGNMILCGRPTVFPYGDRLQTAELSIDCIKYSGAEAAGLPPSLLEEMAQRPDHIEVLKKMKTVTFGGGPLSKEAGDILVKNGIRLVNIIGATETLPLCLFYQKDPELWQYFVYNDDYSGLEWRRATGEEDVYEMVITRKSTTTPIQGIFYTFPNIEEYRTNDLYKPHPTLPHLWKFHGRADNIINLSNGEKLNPTDMEDIIMGHPDVRGALIVGTGKFQPALIVEPFNYPKTEEQVDDLIDGIMPAVAEANKTIATHGRIVRHLIMVAKPEKPFLRADKETVKRVATTKLYHEEIERIYENPREIPLNKVRKLDLGSKEALAQSIQKLFREHLGIPTAANETDFFAAGMDSLLIITAARLMTASLRVTDDRYSGVTIEARDMYAHASPILLAEHILATVVSQEASGERSRGPNTEPMKRLYQRLSQNLVHAKSGRPEARRDQQTVILTGSTGNMGCYLLDQLVRNPQIKKVVCFNRSPDGGAGKQEKAMEERGLISPGKSGKVEFIHATLGDANMGLKEQVYSRLLNEVDRVVHNAWAVNFNMPFDAFEPHIKGVRHLADFAAQAERRVVMVFVSTIGTVSGWEPSRGPVPEASLRGEWDIGGGLGYGQSKLVSSLILEDAAKVGDFPLAVVRVGQIAGPLAEAGAWSRQEWLPTIIASSLHLKALPKHLASMNAVAWVPVEVMSSMILDVGGLSTESDDYHEGYFTGSNPQTTSFDKFVPAIQEYYGENRLPELVSLGEWVERLEASRSADGALGADRNPALKLIDFYRGTASGGDDGSESKGFETRRTVAASPALRRVGPVTPELMIHWCKQWKFESPSARVGRL